MILARPIAGWVLAALAAAFLTSQSVSAASGAGPKHLAPIPTATVSLMASKATTPAAPILMRVYKKEAELEIWKRSTSGRFVHLKTFPICRWSGQLGPKRKEGDRQAPEGFYAVTPGLMNPNSAHYLSFDTGFPNAYDRAQGSTGSALMVHGTCSSAGCYAMTNEAMSEVYALAREAFRGGQRAFQFQAYPFRMTTENLVRHRLDPNIAFWRQLKEGSDRFEATGEEPVVTVSAGRYVFKSAKDPETEAQILAYRALMDDHAAVLLEEGRPAIRTTYADGGQHPSFTALLRRGVSLGDVSRLEALAAAGREIVLVPARPTRPAAPPAPPSTDVAAAVPMSRELRPAFLDGPDGAVPPLPHQPSLFVSLPLLGPHGTSGADGPVLPGSVRIVPAPLSKGTAIVAAL